MKRLQQTISDNEILKLGGVDKGYKFDRTKHEHGEREKSFYNHWKKENRKLSYINFGQGVLQDLFAVVDDRRLFWRNLRGFKVIINRRDRYIVATVMQWLGTNCGWCFLQETLKSCGYRIVKIEEKETRKKSAKPPSKMGEQF